jgi:hypothetical protein
MKLTRLLNKLASLIMVVLFFGVYPRELQEGAPTIFALLSMLIYSVHKYILDRILLNIELKELSETMEEMKKEFDKHPLAPHNLNKKDKNI